MKGSSHNWLLIFNLNIRRFFVKNRFLLAILLFVILLAACNPQPAEEDPTARPTPTVEEQEPGGYPAQPTTDPAAPYPAAPDEAWVIRPAGEQCADSLAYPTSDSAVAQLEEAGVTILAVEEIELIVCEACGCPTSAHYRVLLADDDLSTAFTLGWDREEQ